MSDIKLILDKEAIEVEASSWLARLDSSDVTEQDLENFANWLSAGPNHKTIYESVKQDWHRLSALANLSDLEKHTLERQLLDDSSSSTLRRLTGFKSVAAIAAIIMLSILGFGNLDQFYIPENTFRTDVGEQQSIALDDGSTITLNTDSRVHVKYSAEQRHIMLVSGEAYFDVAHDPSRPFIVQVGDKQVRAVGTAFNILRHKKEFSVLVTDGTVEVSETALETQTSPLRIDTEVSSPHILVTKGEKIKVKDAVTTAIKIASPSPQKDLSWQDGELEFSGETLEEVVQEFSRYTDKKIFLVGDEIKHLKVGGVFEAGNVDALVSALDVMLPVKVTKMTAYVTLLVYEG